MKVCPRVGDLVHIPQAVVLVDCDNKGVDDPQLSIPLSIRETEEPEIGVVLRPTAYGYLRVLVSGKPWNVKGDRVYTIRGENDG